MWQIFTGKIPYPEFKFGLGEPIQVVEFIKEVKAGIFPSFNDITAKTDPYFTEQELSPKENDLGTTGGSSIQELMSVNVIGETSAARENYSANNLSSNSIATLVDNSYPVSSAIDPKGIHDVRT